MIERIVKMSFRTEVVNDFIQGFEESKLLIANFPGCMGLRLLKQTGTNQVYFTYSLWDSESSLENYRNSELFEQTWKRTKVLFNDKPMAWSTQCIDIVK